MTKERELLRRAFVYLSGLPDRTYIQDDIEAYLSTPSDDAEEPVLYWYKFLDEDGYEEECFLAGPSEDNAFLNAIQVTPLYLHPPKPAEPEAETIETLKAENFKLASGQCTEGGPWGDEGGTPYCKYAKRKPMTEEEISKLFPTMPTEYEAGFREGIRFAEKHHGITEK